MYLLGRLKLCYFGISRFLLLENLKNLESESIVGQNDVYFGKKRSYNNVLKKKFKRQNYQFVWVLTTVSTARILL